MTIKGADKLQRRLKRIIPAAEHALRRELEQEAERVAAGIREEMEKPKAGHLYAIVGHTRKTVRVKAGQALPKRTIGTYRASRPGEAPAKAAGVLIKRIQVKKRHRAYRPGVQIVVRWPFVGRVEFGEASTAARPFMRPAYAKNKQRIIQSAALAAKTAIARTR